VPTGLLTCTAPAVCRTLTLARSASAVPGGAGVAKLEAVMRHRLRILRFHLLHGVLYER